MQMMAKMNAKLDIGWKLTTMSCPICNATTMAEPKGQIQEIYCPKCDKKYPFEAQIQGENSQNDAKIEQAEQDESNYYAQIYNDYKSGEAKPSSTSANYRQNVQKNEFQLLKAQEISAPFKKTNDVSKKIGEKLLQGWTMLNESCHDCFVPIMQSKKGEKICCGCNRNFSNTPQINAVKTQKVEKPEKTEIKEVIVKKQEQKPSKPISNVTINKDPKKMCGSAQILQRIELKALEFLQIKIEKSISDNDLSQLQRLLSLAYKIKGQFK